MRRMLKFGPLYEVWDGKTQSNSPKGGQFDRSIATKHEARQDARPLFSVTLTGTERNSHRAQMRRIDIVLRKERSGLRVLSEVKKEGEESALSTKWNKSKKAVYSSSLALRKARFFLAEQSIACLPSL